MKETDQRFGKKLVTFGSATLLTTAVAQYGGHSEIHQRIANAAMVAEVATIAAGTGELFSQNAHKKRIYRKVGITTAALTAAAFFAVPLTDHRMRSYFRHNKSPEDIQTLFELGSTMAHDLKRHTLENANVIRRRFSL